MPFLPSLLTLSILGVASPILPPSQSTPQPALAQPVPVVWVSQGTQQAIAPNWSEISLSSLRMAQTGQANKQVWEKGQALAQLMTLGDFQNSFHLQDLNLYAITLATQTNPKTISLADFKLLHQQTLADLVDAIPDLGKHPVSDVPPLAALLKTTKPAYRLVEQTPVEILVQDPMIGSLTLAGLEQLMLSQYKLTDIPGLIHTPLQAFKGWQDTSITDIPRLDRMPIARFPNPPENTGTVGVIQFPVEANQQTPSISGSNTEGFTVSCPISTCLAATFSHPPELIGRAWIAGNQQWVKGGTGTGEELTGRNVFGGAFKLVLVEMSLNEVKTALYSRHCRSDEQHQTSCDPYEIGPVSFLNYRNGDALLVGDLQNTAVARTPQMIPLQASGMTSPSPTPPETLGDRIQAWFVHLFAWVRNILEYAA